MKLSYYNDEIDKILWDLIGNDYFTDSDFESIIDYVTDTIYSYENNLPKNKLKIIVELIINHKYQKCYLYDNSSIFNKFGENQSVRDTANVNANTNENANSNSNSNEESDMIEITADDLALCDGDDFLSPSNQVVKYFNPELESEKKDKVSLNSANDLVSHRHDYHKETFKEKIYIRRKKKVYEIKKIPQFEQKSKEWLNQRNECLTATAIAIALDEDPYKYPAQLLLDKCGRGEPFEENENVHHGKKYEEVGNMFYSFRNNITVGEYGLLQHKKYKFIGASPDGICDKQTYDKKNLSKLVGRLLEIKFPKKRKINTEGKLDGDICPHYYYLQIQTQLYVTDLDECDFLQCEIEEYESWDDFVKDSDNNINGLSKKTGLEKGCLIQLLPRDMINKVDDKMCLYNSKYIYPNKLHMTNAEIEKWIANEVLNFQKNELSKKYMIDQIIYWRLSKVACHLVKAETEYFESKIPILKQFWNYVLFYRNNPAKLDKLMEIINEVGFKKSDIIFEKVNKDYLASNPKSNYKPLYQTVNEWRKKYDQKYANYQKYLNYQKNKKKVDV